MFHAAYGPEGRPGGAALLFAGQEKMITELQSKLYTYRERLDELRGFL
jgi:hypothetical protein